MFFLKNFRQEFSIDSKDICLFLPVHGVGISKEANELEINDPYLCQTKDLIEAIKIMLSKNDYHVHVELGFQNHDKHPTQSVVNYINWTIPEATKVASRIANDVWRYILIDGNFGFLIDCKETLVEHEYLKKVIEDTFNQNRKHENIHVKNVKIFNSDSNLAIFLSSIILNAIEGIGDLITLK